MVREHFAEAQTFFFFFKQTQQFYINRNKKKQSNPSSSIVQKVKVQIQNDCFALALIHVPLVRVIHWQPQTHS